MKELTEDELGFIIDSLNQTFHWCHNELTKRDLGYIERKSLEKQKQKAIDLIKKIST